MRRHFLFITACIALISTALSSPAKALTVEMPAQWENFPYCSDANANEMCIVSFEVDDDNDGNFDAIGDSDELSANAYVFDIKDDDASFALYINYLGNQELSPRLPLGSKIKVEINTRDWKPSSQAFSTSKINMFQQVEENGEWHTTMGMETISMAFATNCYQEGCDDPQDRIDYESKADFLLFNLDSQTAYDRLFDGMYISSNATSTIWPSYSSETMSWTVDTAGPRTTAGGDENIAYFNAFFPDSAIIAAYGADPASMIGVFKVLRKDGNATVEQEVSISRVSEPVPGILLEIPAYSFASNDVVAPLTGLKTKFAPLAGRDYTSPVHKIKPKTKLLAAPTLRSAKNAGGKAVLSGNTVAGAKSYQGVCIKGSKLKYSTSKNPKVTVKNLSSGNWKCRIRGVKKVGGKWSNQINVKIS